MNSRGTATSRIDFVMHTGAVRIVDAAYFHEFDGRHLAGPKQVSPISDHAALVPRWCFPSSTNPPGARLE
jgi:hypothetical protein